MIACRVDGHRHMLLGAWPMVWASEYLHIGWGTQEDGQPRQNKKEKCIPRLQISWEAGRNSNLHRESLRTVKELHVLLCKAEKGKYVIISVKMFAQTSLLVWSSKKSRSSSQTIPLLYRNLCGLTEEQDANIESKRLNQRVSLHQRL